MAAVRVRPYKENEKRGQKEGHREKKRVEIKGYGNDKWAKCNSNSIPSFQQKESPPKGKSQAWGMSIVHTVRFYKTSLFIYTLGDDANRKCDIVHAGATYFTQIWLQWASIKAFVKTVFVSLVRDIIPVLLNNVLSSGNRPKQSQLPCKKIPTNNQKDGDLKNNHCKKSQTPYCRWLFIFMEVKGAMLYKNVSFLIIDKWRKLHDANVY